MSLTAAKLVEKLPNVISDIVFSYFTKDYIKFVNSEEYDENELLIHDQHLMVPYIDKFNRTELFKYAAKAGDLKNIEWLHENNFPYCETAFAYATQNGHLNIMKWLHEHEYSCNPAHAYQEATNNNYIHILKWLYENKFHYTQNVIADAACRADIKTLEWLYENKFPYCEKAFAWAAELGNIDNMKWMLEHKFPYNEWAFFAAAGCTNINTLEWLLEHKFPYDDKVFTYAVWSQNINTIKWVADHKFPINRINAAVYYNNPLYPADVRQYIIDLLSSIE